MEVILGYLAGLLTLINPCVLPVLPIVLAGALQVSSLGPVALAAGMSLSFVALGITVSAFGFALGLTEDMVAQAGAILMVGFGLILLVPRFNHAFASATVGLATGADACIQRIETTGLQGQFAGGLLLGAVWSPCIGPTLGGAIALAAQGESLLWAATIMVAFALGVSTLIVGLGYGARAALQRRQALMRRVAEKSRPFIGIVFVVVGFALFFRLHHLLDAWLIGVLPARFVDLSVSL
jgi:cytochrome c biogenesis protein CcdA